MKSYFLQEKEYSFFKSFCSFIVPTGVDPVAEPGADEIGTVNYVDSILFEMPKEVQNHFRKSIEIVQAGSKTKFARDFELLNDDQKNALLRELYLDHISRDRIFELRSLALEGFYSDYHDPGYKGKSAWDILRFQGKRISELKKDWTFLKNWRDGESRD